MDAATIAQRIQSFPRWHYQFDLQGQLTPIHDRRWINRHAQRKKYFFDPLVTNLGGSLAGKRVLDLGCNAGFWSLCAAQAGCDFVLGIDGRAMHVEQSQFVFEAQAIDRNRYEFRYGNLFELDFAELGEFDIVLCLGLLYHVTKPAELLEQIARVNRDLLVVDTTLFPFPGAFLHLRKESLEEPRNAVDYELVMYPTRQAVLDLVQQFGYSTRVLKPRFTDYTGSLEYRLGARRAFLCAQHTDLAAWSLDVERPNVLTHVRDLALGVATLAKRRFRGRS